MLAPDGRTLTVCSEYRNGVVQLVISDTGIGLPPGVDILKPFTTTKPQGTGLGLDIARRMVEDHHGTLTYESKPEQGTIFHVSLPVATSQSAKDLCLPSRGARIF